MKKWLTALFTLALVLLLAACGGGRLKRIILMQVRMNAKEETKQLVVGAIQCTTC